MSLFTIDGKSYTVGETKLTRRAALNADKLTRGVMLDESEFIDITSTSYSCSVTVEPLAGYESDYDVLYSDLTQPRSSRAVTLPFGQGTISFDAYVETASDALKRAHNLNRWGGLTVTFTPISPQRRGDA